MVTAAGSGGGGHKYYISLQKYTDVEIVMSDEVVPSSLVTVPPKVCIDSISQTITINITNHLKHNL